MSADKEILALMIAKAEDKFETANLDFQNKKYDDAVSRSYYAVFHVISAALFTRNLSFASHSQTIGAFNKEFIKSGIFPKSYSKKIQTLFDERQSGDYDIRSNIDEMIAKESIDFAKEVLDKIKTYLNEMLF